MLVVIANNIPPAVRGRLKLWFVEPRANIFVSGVKDNVAQKVVDYLYAHCPPDSGLLVFQKIKEIRVFLRKICPEIVPKNLPYRL